MSEFRSVPLDDNPSAAKAGGKINESYSLTTESLLSSVRPTASYHSLSVAKVGRPRP